MQNQRLRIERLESRDVPAVALHYFDVDGDTVHVNISKGTIADLGAQVTFTDPNPLHPRYIQEINLAGTANPKVFAGANITISVARGATGDGFTYVGWINATGIDLGAVTIHGDLGKIVCGDGVSKTDALKSLNVQSLFRFGTTTGAPDFDSEINGKLDSLVVKGDVQGALVRVIDTGGGNRASIDSINIGGSLIGDVDDNSGQISADDSIGRVRIGHHLLGGDGLFTGEVYSGGAMGPVTIGGSIFGGRNSDTGLINGNTGLGDVTVGGSLIGGSASVGVGNDIGEIFSHGDIGVVKIGGTVSGGASPFSGVIRSTDGKLAGVTVGGSLTGGQGENSGEILSGLDLGFVTIGGNMVGGNMENSGQVKSGGKIGAVTVHGSTFFGTAVAATIMSTGDIGSIKIGGDLSGASIRSDAKIGSIAVNGSVGGSNIVTVHIYAQGKLNPTSRGDSVAIGKVNIGGSVMGMRIQAGYDHNGTPTNPDASIGIVKVGGDWIGSDLIAGIQDGGDFYFGRVGGTIDETVIPGGNAAIKATISSIAIGGQIMGTLNSFDSEAFAAEVIGSMKVGGATIALPGPHQNFNFTDPFLSDVTVEEL